MRWLYTALFHLALPLIFARLAWRGIKLPAYRRRWSERLARYGRRYDAGVLWFHAVSVGESEAAFPLIRALRTRFPHYPILVTCTTPTGSARITSVLGDSVQHVYIPYDLPTCIGRFMECFRPVLGVVLETEIWPNLFLECHKRGIPLALVNGRMSERSARGYARLAGLAGESMAALSLVAAQTGADADRYRALGAAENRVVVTGNVKFDLEFSGEMRVQAQALRTRLFGERPVVVAGSTHANEDEQILSAVRELRAEFPDLVLVLAPRHPERWSPVAALCERQGFQLRRRSDDAPCGADDGVFLLDSLGELRLFYGMADLAFVGGSLVPVGGHNVLEPAAAGVPVLYGPHMFNFAEIGRKLKDAGGGIQVADVGELTRRMGELLRQRDLRADMGRAACGFVQANRGAVQHTTELLAGLIAGSRLMKQQAANDSGMTIE